MTRLGFDAFEIRFYVLRERRAGERRHAQGHYKCRDAIDPTMDPPRRVDHVFEWLPE